MPARQHIREAAAQQARPVNGVLDAERCDDTKMRQEVGRVPAREPFWIRAAEVDAADQLLPVQQRDQSDAGEARRARTDELMVAGRVRTKPRVSQGDVLRRHAGQRFDHDEILEN